MDPSKGLRQTGNWNDVTSDQSRFDSLSIEELNDFILHPVWDAIEDTLKKRKKLILSELELGLSGSGKPLNLEDYRERNGECSNINYILGLVPKILEIKIEERERSKAKETSDEE